MDMLPLPPDEPVQPRSDSPTAWWRSPRVRTWLTRLFFSRIPHGRKLGIRVLPAEPDAILAELPYQHSMVGNPLTGIMHSGPIVVLIDQTCGATASLGVVPPAMVATLDLRLDWVRAATAGRPVRARAECRRIARNIVFVHCTAYHDDPADPLVLATATFMRSGPMFRNPFRRRTSRGRNGGGKR